MHIKNVTIKLVSEEWFTMLLIPKKGKNCIDYDADLAKKIDYVIIVNDVDSSNVGDLFSIWNQKCKVIICNDITDYYDFLKREKRIGNNTNIMIIGTKNTEYDTILDYQYLTSFYLFYTDESKKIDKEINKWNKNFINKNDNVLIKDALNQLIYMNSNGKYLRALLIALGYYSTKKTDDSYLALAAAYETFQTSILIHDDLIDNSTMRRGKTTINNKYMEKFDKYDLKDQNFEKKKCDTANSLSLCIGDLGFYIANNMIMDSYRDNDNLYSVLKFFNEVVIKTIKGEIIDVILPFNEEYNSKNKCLERDVMEIYELKTAWYTIVGPFALGMLLAGSKERTVESLVKTLMPLGIAFQIKDDLLGVYGDVKKMGKSTNSDVEEYKQTLLYYYTIDQGEYAEELKKYYGRNLKEKELEHLKDIFDKSGAKKYAIDVMNNLFLNAKKNIVKNRHIPTKYREIMMGLIIFLEIREN